MAESTLLSRNRDTGIPARAIGATTIPDLLRSNGCVIFDRVLPQDTVAQICDERRPSLAATECGRGDLPAQNTRIRSVLQKSRVALHPDVLCFANDLLGADSELFQTVPDARSARARRPLARMPHRDYETWQGDKCGTEYLVNAIWALSHFTVEDDASMIWPHSPVILLTTGRVSRSGDAPCLGGSASRLHELRRLKSQPGAAHRASLQLLPPWPKQCWNSIGSYPPEVTNPFSEALRETLELSDRWLHPRDPGSQDSSLRFDSHSRMPQPAHAIPTAIARHTSPKSADGVMPTPSHKKKQ